MFNNILKMPRVLNKSGFWIWHAGICNDTLVYATIRRVPRMSDYDFIHLNNAWIYLNMPQYLSICLTMVEYCWMFLNMPENAKTSCSDYARVLNIPRYSYNNIIIVVTNVIITDLIKLHLIRLTGFWIKYASCLFLFISSFTTISKTGKSHQI